MEEFENILEKEKYSFRKLCEQIHRAFEGLTDIEEADKDQGLPERSIPVYRRSSSGIRLLKGEKNL